MYDIFLISYLLMFYMYIHHRYEEYNLAFLDILHIDHKYDNDHPYHIQKYH